MSEADIAVLELKIETLREQLTDTKAEVSALRAESKRDLEVITQTLTNIQIELASQKANSRNAAVTISTVISALFMAAGWFVGHLQQRG